MSTLNFPTSPSLNQQYSFGGKTWYWTGDAWRLLNTGAINNIPIGNVTPSTGNFTQLTSVGNISATGNITGAFLYGNGRYLTGIQGGGGGGGGSYISNAGSTVNIPVANGPVLIDSSGVGNTAIFAGGNITVSANIIPGDANVYTLGTPDLPFAEGYFASNSVWIGDAKITSNASSMIFTNPLGGAFVVEGTGGGIANITAENIIGTATVTAPEFYGNLHGNVTGNFRVSAANTEVLFSNDGVATGSPHFTFDDNQNILSVSGSITAVGNVQAAYLNGNGVGLTNTLVDKGTDTNNWNTLTQMGVYTVNRSSWSGTEGTPLDSQVYVGLLEVKTSQNQTTTQIFYPGQVDVNDIKIQWNRNLWSGSWTPWVKMTNDSQQISGGEF